MKTLILAAGHGARVRIIDDSQPNPVISAADMPVMESLVQDHVPPQYSKWKSARPNRIQSVLRQVLAKVFICDTSTPGESGLMQASVEERQYMNPGISLKTVLALSLSPVVNLTRRLGEVWFRLWAYAGLRSELPNITDSIVVLRKPEIHGTRRISLGRDLFLYRDIYLETQGEGRIHIGNKVMISRGVHIVAHRNVHIGEGTMIGEYSSIRDANRRFGSGRALRDSGFDSSAVLIGRNVWIGRGVTILPGVIIGDNAMIGDNAVVTQHVPGGAVVGGVPARPLHQELAA